MDRQYITRRFVLAGAGGVILAGSECATARPPDARVAEALAELKGALNALCGGEWGAFVDYELGLVAVSRSNSQLT